MTEIFIRTRSGLQNAHLFHNSDYIVYCESHPDVPEAMSWDIGFWSKVISTYQPELNITFKPQGGKLAILAIADSLGLSKGHRTICCVDRDFSDLHRSTPEYDFVVETYGYAFENDMCNVDSISHAIDYMMPGPTSIDDIKNRVDEARRITRLDFKWAVIGDQILSFYFRSLFFRESKKYKALCNVNNAHDEARFSRTRAIERIKLEKSKINTCRSTAEPFIDHDTWRRMLGHLCWWLHFRIGTNIMTSLGYRGHISEDSFAAACLVKFSDQLKGEDFPISIYYRDSLSSAFSAAA